LAKFLFRKDDVVDQGSVVMDEGGEMRKMLVTVFLVRKMTLESFLLSSIRLLAQFNVRIAHSKRKNVLIQIVHQEIC
jgi:hypothetical protein